MAAGTMALSTSISQTKAINPWLIAITVTLATFMELLDTAIANVSLPHIAGGLATSYDESTWVLTSYLVANAVVLPLSAWLSRVFGRKNVWLGTKPEPIDLLPSPSRHGRRRLGPSRASDSRGYVSRLEACGSFCPL